MPAGRKSRPTVLKVLAGERQDRINHDEPQPDDGMPTCPSTDPDVIDVWNYTAGQLHRMRVLTMADRDMLLVFCQAVKQWRDATAMLAQDGVLAPRRFSDGSLRAHPHPALKVQQQAEATIKGFGVEFGLTPAARTRIKVGDTAPEKTQGAARLLSS